MSTAGLALCVSPVDELEALGDEIATLAAHLEAAHYRLLVLLREFDEREGWAPLGARSCAHWLSFRIGIGLNAARERVRVARALAKLPQVSRALEGGELSFAKVRALTRVATPENEAELLTFARHGTASQLEKIVRRYRGVLEAEAQETERGRQEARYLQTWTDEQGMLHLEGKLPPEDGAAFQKALELAMAELERAASTEASSSGQSVTEVTSASTPAQRRADALGLLSRSALDHQLQRGSAADQTQVILHVDAEALAKGQEQGRGLGEHAFERGGNVSSESARRLSCDASVITLLHGEKGRVLSVGRKTRTIPPAIRRALEAREPCCAFPGCDERRFLQVHHLEHWADGGETKLENLGMLCHWHHELVHEGGFRVSRSQDGTLSFFRPDGRPIVPSRGTALTAVPPSGANPLGPPSTPPPRIEDGVESLVLENQRLGHELSKDTIRTGGGERCDYGEAVDLLLRARQRKAAGPACSPRPLVASEQESDAVSSTEESEGVS